MKQLFFAIATEQNIANVPPLLECGKTSDALYGSVKKRFVPPLFKYAFGVLIK
jgi:hypothetical protein